MVWLTTGTSCWWRSDGSATKRGRSENEDEEEEGVIGGGSVKERRDDEENVFPGREHKLAMRESPLDDCPGWSVPVTRSRKRRLQRKRVAFWEKCHNDQSGNNREEGDTTADSNS